MPPSCLYVNECDYYRIKRFIFRYDKQDVSFAKRSLKTKKVYGYDCPVGSIMAELACGMFHCIVIYYFIFHIAKGDWKDEVGSRSCRLRLHSASFLTPLMFTVLLRLHLHYKLYLGMNCIVLWSEILLHYKLDPNIPGFIIQWSKNSMFPN